jgi:hypothetical protein
LPTFFLFRQRSLRFFRFLALASSSSALVSAFFRGLRAEGAGGSLVVAEFAG